MSDTQHENGMFFARRVKLTKNLPSSDHFTKLNSNVDQIEFAWLNIYNPPHCFTPEPVDFQHFVQGAFAQGFDAPAIVHVTKGHVSAVVHVGGTVFMGFSTSGSRFPKAVSSEADIAGTFHLDARAAKDFLNGR